MTNGEYLEEIDYMLKKYKKKLNAQLEINYREWLSRSLVWKVKDKDTNTNIIKKFEISLDSNEKNFNVCGYAWFDNYDEAIRYWKLLEFGNGIKPPINEFISKNIESFIEKIVNIKKHELVPAGTIDSPFPFIPLKYAMKIAECIRAVDNLFGARR